MLLAYFRECAGVCLGGLTEEKAFTLYATLRLPLALTAEGTRQTPTREMLPDLSTSSSLPTTDTAASKVTVISFAFATTRDLRAISIGHALLEHFETKTAETQQTILQAVQWYLLHQH